MVHNSGANSGAKSIRPVNPPIPVDAWESARQTPHAVKIKGHWVKVAAIVDVCSLDEEWWRDRPIVRMYYRVDLEGGRHITVFRDMVDGAWYRQNV